MFSRYSRQAASARGGSPPRPGDPFPMRLAINQDRAAMLIGSRSYSTSGVRVVAGPTSPNPRPVAMTPAATNSSFPLYKLSFVEQAAAANLQASRVFINTAVDAHSAGYLAYCRPGDPILRFPDYGNGANVQRMVLGGEGQTHWRSIARRLLRTTGSPHGLRLEQLRFHWIDARFSVPDTPRK